MANDKVPGSAQHPTLSLGAALDQSQPLTQLLQRLQASRARFESVRSLLPQALQTAVQPGPLDETGWTLLVPGGPAAAKLRQLLPDLQAAMDQQHGPSLPIRIRIRGR
ncbi:MAG: hypothetical protein J0M00_01830 [Burkholderiales bacterium]|nr:hypothetical protein [Burkholderiales bacterium]